MGTALLVARLLLAAVFAVAGLAKLADRAGSRRAIVNFGVPAVLASPLAIALPLAELAVAAALVPRSTAWWGALGAVALLLLFVAAIAANLARGRTPDCHCFGQLHSAPAGRRTLARNGVLAAVAGFVVWAGRDDPGLSALAWAGDLTAPELVAVTGAALALGGVTVLAWFVLNLLRQQGRLLLRLDALEARVGGAGAPSAGAAQAAAESGLPVGAPAPSFELSGLHGETLTLDFLRSAGKPVLLLFSDPECGPCNELLPEIGRWQREHAGALTVAPVSRGTPDANRAKSAEHGLTNVLLQADREIADAYQAHATPTAVVVRADGTIGSPLAAGPAAIRALVANAASGGPATVGFTPPPVGTPQNGSRNGGGSGVPAPLPAPEVGARAPKVKLPDLTGRRVDLASFRGNDTLVLFWNPGCSYCTELLEQVKGWEESPPKGIEKLVVVSSGTVESNRAMGLRSPVLLDEGFQATNRFGVTGTPSAVLVDRKGRIASPIAVSAPGIHALIRELAGEHGSSPTPQAAPTAGPAPPFALPDLDGNMVDVADFRGDRTVVLFWNPQCGFCQQMLGDLKAWEANPPSGAPRLVVVSSGSPEANRAMGLRSPVLLDDGSNVAGRFGASGTPMAVLLDERGDIASHLAVGATDVLALAGNSDRAASS